MIYIWGWEASSESYAESSSLKPLVNHRGCKRQNYISLLIGYKCNYNSILVLALCTFENLSIAHCNRTEVQNRGRGSRNCLQISRRLSYLLYQRLSFLRNLATWTKTRVPSTGGRQFSNPIINIDALIGCISFRICIW